jgi:hypothetical protein
VPPPPTSTLAPTNTPIIPCLVGDADGDGDRDAVDAALILQLAAGLISELPGEAICP